jgi:ABC-type proline/glycine betaine transport system ATPase subunit
MDDPISAVDANVRHQLMTNVMFDYLNKKTRILVTHAIDFLHLADKVILINQGRIDA